MEGEQRTAYPEAKCIKFSLKMKHQSLYWVIQETMKTIKHHVVYKHETCEGCDFQHGSTDHINEAIISYWPLKQNGRRFVKQYNCIIPKTSDLQPK